jgi:hypothetical protein
VTLRWNNGVHNFMIYTLADVPVRAHDRIGPVGYFYQQITDDKGAPAFLDGNRSRVIGVGPQIGFLFPVNGVQGYLNIDGYGEFDAEHRASGWSAWASFAISPEARKPETGQHMASQP